MRSPDGPRRVHDASAATLEARLEKLPANHPSSLEHADFRVVEREKRGAIDERFRPFPPDERAIAEALAGRGAIVVALAEDHSLRKRQPDAVVDGRVTEFKSLRPGATDATVKNQLLAAKGQAPNVVVDARGSGLDEGGAAHGLRRFQGGRWGPGHYDTILILGDGYAIEASKGEEPQ
jgi:Contact-dependent growth inhibition CdiA C-terminal domain